MQQLILRPCPVRPSGIMGAVSRCGTGLSNGIILAAFLFLSTGPLRATPLQQWMEPASLVSGAQERLDFFDPRPDACAQDAGCLVEIPHHAFPAALAAPLRRHLPSAAARSLLPLRHKWLLASSGSRLRPGAILPPAPRVGQHARAESMPFDLVARADRLHVAGLFFIGTVLMILGAGLGLLVRQPAEPAVPRAEPWIPEKKLVPRLVASPVSAAHLKTQVS